MLAIAAPLGTSPVAFEAALRVKRLSIRNYAIAYNHVLLRCALHHWHPHKVKLNRLSVSASPLTRRRPE